MSLPLTIADDVDPHTLLGVVVAHGVDAAAPAADLDVAIAELVAVRASQDFPPPELRARVRALLRYGGYKPSGRGKPASEYLAAAARKDAFPRIGPVVDAANRYSLLTGWPVSLVDLDRAAPDGEPLVARIARPEESYVFNQSGQEIALDGLLVLARQGGAPFANAVKDSLSTRVHDGTTKVLAVIYATSTAATRDIVERMAAQLGDELRRHAGATAVVAGVLSAADHRSCDDDPAESGQA